MSTELRYGTLSAVKKQMRWARNNPKLPEDFRGVLQQIHERFDSIKSFTYYTALPNAKLEDGTPVYWTTAAEGYTYWKLYKGEAASVEIVSEFNFGASNVHYGIGDDIVTPVGGTLFVVTNGYGGYCLWIYNIQPDNGLNDGKLRMLEGVNDGEVI